MIASFPVPNSQPSNGRAGTNAVNFAYQQNPSEAQFLGMQRNQRLGDGAFWFSYFGAQPHYANLAVTPSGGLFVQVAPAVSGSIGSVYAIQPDDATIFGVGANALSADPTIIGVQGNLTTPAIGVGPLTPPNGAGQSVSYLVECTVVREDQNPFQYNFINNSNQVTQQTIYHDRNDVVTCQQKASVAAATPVTPTADAGYVGVAAVVVPYGTTTISSGAITAQSAGAVGVPLQSQGGATINSAGCFTTGASSVCPTGIASSNGISLANGLLTTPAGVNASLCPSSNCTLTATTAGVAIQGVINATGSISSSNGNVSGSSGTFGGLSATYGAFGSGSYVANAQQLTIGNDGSNSFFRSGSGGFYFQNGPANSTYAVFNSSGATISGALSATGNVSGVQGNFSSGLTASTGSFSSGLTATEFRSGGSYLNSSGVWSNAGYIAANGVFQSPSGASVCANSGALCLQVNNGRGSTNGPDVTTGGTISAGTANANTPNAYSWGSSTVGGVDLGADPTHSLQGIPGNVMRIAECTSTNSACDSGTATFLTLNSTGDLAVLGRMWGQ